MKLKVYGGGGSFSVKIEGSDHILEVSKGLTAYEACHELARWLEDVTESVVTIGPEDIAPETQPNPPPQDVPAVAQTSEPSREAQDAGANPAGRDASSQPQAESLDHGSPGAKFGSPGVTDWLDQGQPDHLAPVPASVAPAPTEPAPAPTPAEVAPEPPKGAA